MIVWLSSFPRSGNTLVRLMLKQVWGISTCSMYDDRDDIGANPAVAQCVGHQFLGGKFDDAYKSMHDSTELFCVKSHDVPIDQSKSIYIVRDGRGASYSYWHYQRDHGQLQGEATLADTLIGFTPFGSWSDHLDAWEPLQRPNTLTLRYEELVVEPDQQIERIADFLELRPLRPWKNDFDALHRLDPRFFREGSHAPPPKFEEAEESLFWLLHGAWMTRLGYASADVVPATAPRITRHLFYQSIARHQGQFSSLNRALSQQRGEKESIERQLLDLRFQLADATNQMEDAKRRLSCAEQEVATLSQFRLLRAWNVLRASSLTRCLALGRPLRAGIAATLAVLAAAIHSE